MFEDTRPALLDGDAGDGLDAFAEFRVEHPQERLSLLRQLQTTSAPVILSAPGGANLATTLWSIDPSADRMTLATEPQHPHLPRLLDAGEATAVSYLDSVKLQFDLVAPMLVRGFGTASLQCMLPRALYRFQRRQAYRVRPSHRPLPTASFRHPSVPGTTLALRVVDISVGGCALWLPADVPTLQPGSRIAEATLVLDAQTRFTAAMTLQHVGDFFPGEDGVRVGCAWLPLTAEASRALQRWIDQSQKRHRMVLAG